MKTTLTILAAIAAVTAATTADARPNSPAEQRGYQACLEANQDAFRGLIPDRHYLVNETDAGRTYYINATAWAAGERVNVAFTCETNRVGRLQVNRGATYTRYVPALDPVQVAGQ
jgi:hypothetical protein